MITRDTTTGGDWSPIARVPPAKPKAQRDSESDCSTLSAPPSSKPQSPDYFV
ncbi:hypothetical protein BC834DRAFT_908522 [Gloeopeniophorella convolvens]|nr:hypothetical protein BC834DRAFT_908522 [Gloeopeniophorella convolvens]